MPPHHYLFHSYVYQYHLMQFSGIVVSMVWALNSPFHSSEFKPFATSLTK